MKKETLSKLLVTLSICTLPLALHAKPDMPGGGGKPDMPGKVEKKMKPDLDKPDVDSPADRVEKKADEVEDVIKDKDKEMPNKGNSDKSDAIRKEAGKGSETGQAKREENSRKWWKFWGD